MFFSFRKKRCRFLLETPNTEIHCGRSAGIHPVRGPGLLTNYPSQHETGQLALVRGGSIRVVPIHKNELKPTFKTEQHISFLEQAKSWPSILEIEGNEPQ